MRSVLFDLDGVLVATDHLHFLAWKKLAEELEIQNFSYEDNKRQRGVSRMASLDIVLEKAQRCYSKEEKEDLADRKNEYYVQMLQGLTHSAILPGAQETLVTLRKLDVKIAVGSASKNALQILEKTGLIELIDKVSCGLDSNRSKPDPEVFLIAAAKLAVPPSACLVVEDADAGIQAAKAGGMTALALGSAQGNPLADYHASSLADPSLDWCEMLALQDYKLLSYIQMLGEYVAAE